MAYSIAVLFDLITRFPSWAALEAYLTSEEGGSIRIVGEGRYRILRYVKGKSRLDSDTNMWLRSVIWDTEKHRPVCVAPPKAQKGDIPTGEEFQMSQVEDFLDGTMINVFRNFGDDQIHVATRTQLGAGGTFYSSKTFAALFQEALAAMGLTLEQVSEALGEPSEDKPAVFGSFLLAHPEHRIVSRCGSPHVWVIHTGAMHWSGVFTIYEQPTEFGPALRRLGVPQHLVTGFKTEKDLASFFGSLVAGKGWFWQGLVAKDGRGRRWRMRNPNYLYLRSLRGGEAKAEDRFLRLRNESKVTEYLKHYGEDRDLFWSLETALRNRTQDIFTAYAEVHKSRVKKLADVDKAVQPFVYRLHAHYLEHLRPEGKTITKKEVVDLVNNAPQFEQRRLLEAVEVV